MAKPTLIETRGEEPAFLPGHVDESWRRVDFGLGASTLGPAPGVPASVPPRTRRRGRPLARTVAGALAVGLLALLARLVLRP